MTGYTTAHSWPVAKNFKTYFAIRIYGPLLAEKSGIGVYQQGVACSLDGEGENIGYHLALDMACGGQMEAQVAISYIGVEQALENLRQEENEFEELKSRAGDIWEQHLSRIQIRTDDEDLKKTFYSCLYRTMLYPHLFAEVTPEGKTVHYRPHDGGISPGIMYTDNGFWDTFRTEYPLLFLILPEKAEEILEGFLNIYKDTGWLPKWPSPGEVGMMPGTLLDGVIAQAAVTGAVKRELLELGLQAMKEQAVKVSDNPRYGRRGMDDFRRLGYLPSDDYLESVNHTLDYVYGDFCLTQVARVLGDDATAKEYGKRANSYTKLFDARSGFMRAKKTGWFFCRAVCSPLLGRSIL